MGELNLGEIIFKWVISVLYRIMQHTPTQQPNDTHPTNTQTG